jgi:hypothetical protein
MTSVETSRKKIEQVHIDFLISEFGLIPYSNFYRSPYSRPDLVTDDGRFLVEMKSKHHSINQEGRASPRKLKSDMYTELDTNQIRNHEKTAAFNDADLFWMIVLGLTPKIISQLGTYDETKILERLILVYPWFTPLEVPVSNTQFINLGPPFYRSFEYQVKEINKGWIGFHKETTHLIKYFEKGFNFYSQQTMKHPCLLSLLQENQM